MTDKRTVDMTVDFTGAEMMALAALANLGVSVMTEDGDHFASAFKAINNLKNAPINSKSALGKIAAAMQLAKATYKEDNS